MSKYGINDLYFSILIGCPIEELLQNEQYYLDSHKTYFNICTKAGNTIGVKPSQETRMKMSLSRKGKSTKLKGRKRDREVVERMIKTITGRKRSEEFKANRRGPKNHHYGIPASELNKKRTKEANSKKVINILTGEIFNSIRQTARCIGMHEINFANSMRYNKGNIFKFYKPLILNEMSKSNPHLENPCKKWIDFKSDEGKFYFYDKENDKKVEIPLPIYFCTLDELSTITGFNKKHDSGIVANEVSSIMYEQLRVKTFKGGESVSGFYKDIRDNIVAMGGKFTKSIYALLIKEDMSYEFVNFKFKGAAFSSWLDKKFNPMNFIVGITECVEEKNGNNKYMVPIFKPFKSNPEIDAAAVEQDKILQDYLKIYKAQIPEKETEQAIAVEESSELKQPSTSFEANDIWRGQKPKTKEEIVEKSKEMTRGKRPVKSMSDISELPGAEEVDNVDGLPF